MENYEVLEHLGNGSFGKVCRIVRKSDNKVLVWKELIYGNMNEKEKQQLVAEVNILRELKHPNIVKYHDRIIDKQNQKIWIIMEHCEGGDLGQLIKKTRTENGFIPEDHIWKYFMQIVLALHVIHNRKEGKILHRDLKPANLFLDSSNTVKLGDFGLSKVLMDENGFAYTTVGTPYYMSPEQIKDNKYNEKSDVWACGCLIYELCALKRPFEAANHLSLALKIKTGKFDRIPKRYSDELQRVISWILTLNYDQRPSVEDLLNIPEISMRLREKRCEDMKNSIKKKETDIEKRIQELQDLEIALKNRESELLYKEKKLSEEEKEHLTSGDKARGTPSLKTLEADFKERDIPRPRTGSSNHKLHNYLNMDITSDRILGSERNFSIDRTLNSTLEGPYSSNRGTRTSLRTEESVGQEVNINMEINDILRNMDKIFAQKRGYVGITENSPKFEAALGGFREFARKNSNKFLQA